MGSSILRYERKKTFPLSAMRCCASSDMQRLILSSASRFRDALSTRPIALKSAERFTKALAGLVQLRLRITYRAAQKVGDLAMPISLDIMQDKNPAETCGQPLDAAHKIYSVDRAPED
jgi:hypothetical protein